MYLIIFEDGSVVKTNVVTESDVFSCDQGYITIVDISNSTDPQIWGSNGWCKVKTQELYEEN